MFESIQVSHIIYAKGIFCHKEKTTGAIGWETDITELKQQTKIIDPAAEEIELKRCISMR